ncbi:MULTISPECIES: 23S rRNA pseudouridine(2604) synthase RluF [unclassified Myroides]|uniref:23S rRNA pseudouridine(2604) synthase RluF n=1 Tax=unclassified Myroides TaxID=2642485 RepID=UPI0015FC1C8F|nr:MULTISPECIES: 23S rRNA pseudouridine(2604) synthase RluF [unclassified Myroides]MBB1150897.1 23S rRNA pseudouridine(2604) synthase RluF [Myroides sp. NP-2]MDM1407848.1 23S rRNA pseudouridine(2604) synthase RluF [Myroides sp. DF42-4-2]
MENQETRLNKYLSEVGFCSRREADRLIEEGRITVNGKLPELGLKVTDADEIRVNGKLIRQTDEDFVYLAFNKPVGIECTTNKKVRDNIVDYINYPKRIFPVGRLDKDSEGLIIMTNDGDIVNKILRQKNNHEKEYIVTVNKPITDRFIQRMGMGVPILDTITKECRVERISRFVFRIFLTQGLNRQIRRMCEYFGYDVVALKRIRIINISLDVPVGQYREITAAELAELNQLIAPSIKTEEASLNRAADQQDNRTTQTDFNTQEDRRPKKKFDRERNNSKKSGPTLRNERISRRREN